ncbi:hypothetical protein IW262DRAFT_1297881 [Armillaria fumosa]|nr:hypothetical protein IW262DRAFT_1297881 [Armillaria fumosa]
MAGALVVVLSFFLANEIEALHRKFTQQTTAGTYRIVDSEAKEIEFARLVQGGNAALTFNHRRISSSCKIPRAAINYRGRQAIGLRSFSTLQDNVKSSQYWILLGRLSTRRVVGHVQRWQDSGIGCRTYIKEGTASTRCIRWGMKRDDRIFAAGKVANRSNAYRYLSSCRQLRGFHAPFFIRPWPFNTNETHSQDWDMDVAFQLVKFLNAQELKITSQNSEKFAPWQANVHKTERKDSTLKAVEFKSNASSLQPASIFPPRHSTVLSFD